MLENLFKKSGKLLFLVPGKYWTGATAVTAGLMLLGIGNTLISKPEMPKTASMNMDEIDSDLTGVFERNTDQIPPSLLEENIFRNERKSYTPPSSPAQPGDAAKENDTFPDIKLKGTILAGDKRIAILDGVVRKYIKTEIYERPGLSGAKFLEAKAKGENFELQPIGEEKLAGESFYEGAEVSSHVIERIFEDHIEVTNIKTGKRTSVYLDIEEHENHKKAELAGIKKNPEDKPQMSDFELSGARTKGK